MSEHNIYTADNSMKDLIEDNSLMLMVISRFGISLGFGDKTVAEVCRDNSIDTATFVTIANFMSGKDYDIDKIDMRSLLIYLKNAHTYFVGFFLPMIRRKLIEAIDIVGSNSEISLLILKFYDQYVAEVEKHMSFENDTIFTRIENLLAGAPLSRHSIKAYAAHHDSVATRLKELKDIIVRYIPQKNSDLMISVLYDIITCEQDLTSHCRVEDQIMVPLALRLEEVAAERAADVNDDDEPEQAVEVDQLSQREKEIIACVARGLSNKEIADTLCLSVHTVTTHRRNISAKLQIHSPAGLTIYAIINHLVNLDQIHSIK